MPMNQAKSPRSRGGFRLHTSNARSDLCLPNASVVLLVVNRFRSFVFLVVHLLPFRRREFSAVRRTIVVNFLVQVRLLILQVR